MCMFVCVCACVCVCVCFQLSLDNDMNGWICVYTSVHRPTYPPTSPPHTLLVWSSERPNQWVEHCTWRQTHIQSLRNSTYTRTHTTEQQLATGHFPSKISKAACTCTSQGTTRIMHGCGRKAYTRTCMSHPQNKNAHWCIYMYACIIDDCKLACTCTHSCTHTNQVTLSGLTCHTGHGSYSLLHLKGKRKTKHKY